MRMTKPANESNPITKKTNPTVNLPLKVVVKNSACRASASKAGRTLP
jgi:hypothetical protein